uniref:Uncharacterized protein n=1 Tax=Timema bartmani TaxID=61472 RepID=A0A7R9I5R0_9NEOP|nr:unnamed protein product [Timema bartmani]
MYIEEELKARHEPCQTLKRLRTSSSLQVVNFSRGSLTNYGPLQGYKGDLTPDIMELFNSTIEEFYYFSNVNQ